MIDDHLHQERRKLRTELRRAARYHTRDVIALDDEDLLVMAALGDVGSHGQVTKRRLIVRGLLAAGISKEVIAARWRVRVADVVEDATARLVESGERARAIDEEVIRRLPERPEPGRYVPPAGDQAVPGIVYDERRAPDYAPALPHEEAAPPALGTRS